jgi:acetyl-CoA carboxylase biotin carboxylase subunit
MNTRLQVEHPVTEMVTGIDLVSWQLDVAEGKPLSLTQDEIAALGHSMEFRLYAEDPVTFMPSPGKINEFILPENEKVRVDFGYKQGNSVTPFYDPMIAKIIVSDSTRESVIAAAEQFFSELTIEGLKTNAALFQRILRDEQFREGSYTTAFLAKQPTKQ